MLEKEFLRATALWFNHRLKLKLNPIGQSKGIVVIGDPLDDSFNVLPIEAIVNIYNVNINFLEYHSIRLMINDFLE